MVVNGRSFINGRLKQNTAKKTLKTPKILIEILENFISPTQKAVGTLINKKTGICSLECQICHFI
ncbi:hypothetical protein GCM10011514_12050 [Emticicia aquatilis]|uniref:Uncharacterized protein n=1 Tax=Emticicia aquatilis TaxID=1537369 RepID=A0A917DMY3_9BACT|nr:hypothetical protein GCM10011514_12050 [Emticicia aquatilis]